ncbi:MAG: FAD-dependent oxidoreductase, partial [Deinococcales bacterium]
MPASGRTPGAGVVSATPERPAPRETYDVAVIGGGLLGAAVAERLRSLAPQASVVLIEADGLPNESGATVASPGLIPPLSSGFEATGASAASPRLTARRWARGWLGEMLAGSPAAGAAEAGWLALMEPEQPMRGAAPLDRLVDATVLRAVTALTGVE